MDAFTTLDTSALIPDTRADVAHADDIFTTSSPPADEEARGNGCTTYCVIA